MILIQYFFRHATCIMMKKKNKSETFNLQQLIRIREVNKKDAIFLQCRLNSRKTVKAYWKKVNGLVLRAMQFTPKYDPCDPDLEVWDIKIPNSACLNADRYLLSNIWLYYFYFWSDTWHKLSSAHIQTRANLNAPALLNHLLSTNNCKDRPMKSEYLSRARRRNQRKLSRGLMYGGPSSTSGCCRV